MIRMLLEDMLGELGYTVAAEAAGIEEALEATKNAELMSGESAYLAIQSVNFQFDARQRDDNVTV